MDREPGAQGADVAQDGRESPKSMPRLVRQPQEDHGGAGAVPRETCLGWQKPGSCESEAKVKGYCRKCYYRMRDHEIREGNWLGQVRKPATYLDPVERAALAALRAYYRNRGCWPCGELLLRLIPGKEDRKLLARGLNRLLEKGVISYQLVPVGLVRRHRLTRK